MDLLHSEKFTKHVEDLMEEWHVPGLAIALVQDDKIDSRGFGKADPYVDHPTAVTGDTVFDIASSSKSTTAAAIALLVEDDENYPQVQWDTPVSKLLPHDFVMASEEYTKGVTIEDILSHRSGLPGHDFSYLSPRAKEPDTLQSVTRNIRNLDIFAPIRTKYMYCNMMFTVAAYLVEHLSGLSFEDFLHHHFWTPLEMKTTNLQTKKALEAGLHLAHPTKWHVEGQKYIPVEPQYAPEALGAGLVVTSVKDYARWVKALINQEHPIAKGVYDGLTRPRSFEDIDMLDDLPPHTSPSLYSTGLSSYYQRGYQVVCHDGSDPGTTSAHFFMPQKKFGCVVFSNSEGGGNIHTILRHELVDEILGIPEAERADWVTRERGFEEKDKREDEESKKKMRKELCPEHDGETQPQPGTLEPYVGIYWNAGYHEMKVEIDQAQTLSIDATDRTMGFTFSFEHLCNGTKYIAHRIDYFDGSDYEMPVEFIFEDWKVVKMGLGLEEDIDGEKIWFERRNDSKSLPERLK